MERVAQDIEQLLIWAFDEVERRELMVTESGRNPLYEAIAGSASGSGTSVHAQRYAGILPPHPDALDIERAVKALPEMTIDWPASREALLGALAGFYAAWIDWQECRLRPLGLAQAIAEPLPGSPGDPFAGRRLQTNEIVRRCAVLRRRPVGRLELSLACSSYLPAGRPWTFHIDDHGRRVLARATRHFVNREQCALMWSPTPVEIVRARADYAAWHFGLVRLRAELDGRLTRFRPTGPRAPAEPWRRNTVRRNWNPCRHCRGSLDLIQLSHVPQPAWTFEADRM